MARFTLDEVLSESAAPRSSVRDLEEAILDPANEEALQVKVSTVARQLEDILINQNTPALIGVAALELVKQNALTQRLLDLQVMRLAEYLIEKWITQNTICNCPEHNPPPEKKN